MRVFFMQVTEGERQGTYAQRRGYVERPSLDLISHGMRHAACGPSDNVNA
jgi:hypothetical protein